MLTDAEADKITEYNHQCSSQATACGGYVCGVCGQYVEEHSIHICYNFLGAPQETIAYDTTEISLSRIADALERIAEALERG